MDYRNEERITRRAKYNIGDDVYFFHNRGILKGQIFRILWGETLDSEDIHKRKELIEYDIRYISEDGERFYVRDRISEEYLATTIPGLIATQKDLVEYYYKEGVYSFKFK